MFSKHNGFWIVQSKVIWQTFLLSDCTIQKHFSKTQWLPDYTIWKWFGKIFSFQIVQSERMLVCYFLKLGWL